MRPQRSPGSPPRSGLLLHAALMLYLASMFFEGALRYALYQIHAETLIYTRDALVLGIGAAGLLRSGLTDRTACTVLLLLLIHFAVGLFMLPDARQAAFGLKLYLPLMAGLFASECLLASRRLLCVVAALTFSVLLVGIGWDWVAPLPWQGLAYMVDGRRVVASLQWWTGNGQRRLAGFSRSSFEAALYLLLCGLLLVLYLRQALLRMVVWGITGMAIWLTTTKGVLLVYVVLSALYAGFISGLISPRWLSRFLWLPTGLMAGAPLLSVAFPLQLHQDAAMRRTFFSSYLDRVFETWPQAFELLVDHGSLLIGRGIGGIGTPQRYFEPRLYNYADNLFVYMLTCFGSIALVYTILLTARFTRLQLNDFNRPDNRFLYASAVLVLTFGITAVSVENAVVALCLGMLIRRTERKVDNSRPAALARPLSRLVGISYPT